MNALNRQGKIGMLALAALLLASVAGGGAIENNFAPEPEKKLIKFGWDAPDPGFIDAHFAEIDNGMRAYDGMSIEFSSRAFVRDGRAAGSGSMMFGSWVWKKSYFEKEIAQLRKANGAFKTLKHNFINTNSMAPVANQFDWFDDAAWGAITSNFALLAEIAKETGCRGLNLDIENYERQTFQYNPALGHSYADTWNMARRRGREFITAITAKYPDIVLHTFFWLDQTYSCADGIASPYENAEKHIMGLSLAFINGIYDALPETATIVEGMESGGYRASSPSDYNAIAAKRLKMAKRLIDPANLDKYMRRTQLGMATYLDRYIATDEKSIWFISNDDKKNIDLLKQNLSAAAATADEYIWTWSEARSWYPWPYSGWMKSAAERVTRPGMLMEQALPGISDALLFGKSPRRYYDAKIARNELGSNILRNPGFDQAADGTQSVPDAVAPDAIKPWGFWQPPTSRGTVSVKDGILTFADVAGGCILQGVALNDACAYFVRAKGRGDLGNASLAIGWHDREGRWNFWGYNRAAAFSKDLGNGWHEASMLLTREAIPVGAGSMSVQIGVKNGANFDVDSIEAYEIR